MNIIIWLKPQSTWEWIRKCLQTPERWKRKNFMKQVQDAEKAPYRELTLWPFLPSDKSRSLQDTYER